MLTKSDFGRAATSVTTNWLGQNTSASQTDAVWHEDSVSQSHNKKILDSFASVSSVAGRAALVWWLRLGSDAKNDGRELKVRWLGLTISCLVEQCVTFKAFQASFEAFCLKKIIPKTAGGAFCCPVWWDQAVVLWPLWLYNKQFTSFTRA